MTSIPTIGSHAVLVDQQGRFMTFIGKVIDDGQVLKLKYIYNVEFYNRHKLLDAIRDAGMHLVFIEPDERLSGGPIRALDSLFLAMRTARLTAQTPRV